MDNIKKFSSANQNDPKHEELAKKAIETTESNEYWLRTSRLLEKDYGVRRKEERRFLLFKSRAFGLVAATVAILLGSYFIFPLFQSNNPQELTNLFIAEEKIVHPMEYRSKGPEEKLGELRHKAGEAYIKDNFPEAISYGLQIMDRQLDLITTDFFFLGLSYLYSNQASQAIVYFKDAQTKNRELSTNLFEQEIRWYLALAYIKIGEIQQAKPLLEEVEKQNGWKAPQAKELLTTL